MAAQPVVIEEDIDENYEPTSKEISEYADWLGMDLEADQDLLWIARRGLKAPVPSGWKSCQTADGEVFYFNSIAGESVWDHPCDEHHRRLFGIEKKKKSRQRLSEDDINYLRSTGHDDLIPRSKIGTLVATLTDQGEVEVSAFNMVGSIFSTTNLKKCDGSERFRSLRKRLEEQTGEGHDLRLILPDGRILDDDVNDKPVRDLLEISNVNMWPTKPSTAKKAKRPSMIRQQRHEKGHDLGKVNEVPSAMGDLKELPPLKITKKIGFRNSYQNTWNSTVPVVGLQG